MSNESSPTIPYHPAAGNRFLAVVLMPLFVLFALLCVVPLLVLVTLPIMSPGRFPDDWATAVVVFSLVSLLAGAVAAFLGSMMFQCLTAYEVGPSGIARQFLVWRRFIPWSEIAWLQVHYANERAHALNLHDRRGRLVIRLMLQFYNGQIADNMLEWVRWYTTVPMKDTLQDIYQNGRWFRYRFFKLAFPEITTVIVSIMLLAFRIVPEARWHWMTVMLTICEMLAIFEWSQEFGASYWVDHEKLVRKRFGSTVTVPISLIQSMR